MAHALALRSFRPDGKDVTRSLSFGTMLILNKTAKFADVRLSEHELSLINNALNEVCNGVHIEEPEFRTRLGATLEEARNLLMNVSRLLK